MNLPKIPGEPDRASHDDSEGHVKAMASQESVRRKGEELGPIARVSRYQPDAPRTKVSISAYLIGLLFLIAWINGLRVLFG